MSAQVPADRQRGREARAGTQPWKGHTGWGLGAQVPASALPLTTWPCGLGQMPYPLWAAVSHLYCEAIGQHGLHAGCGF